MEAIAPRIHPSVILCRGAVILGQVTIEEGCFIGPNAVLRGDIEPIVVRKGANVQDCVVVHTHKGSPVDIGPNVSVGHGAIVHGATLEERCLIGMNAVVLDHAVVGQRSVIGAGAVVPVGFKVPPRSLAVGMPCRIVKEDDEGVAKMAFENAARYHEYIEEHRAGKWVTVVG